jgi:prolyl-tRNA synthetase
MDVLWDERPKLSPGLKFKDADLVGIPLRIVVGRDAWERKVEFGTRDSGERETIAVEDALGKVVSLWKEACA